MNSVRINPNLVVDKQFFEFLVNTNNIICSIILNGETEKGINFIKSLDSEFISYLQDEKKKDDVDPFTQSNRVRIRIGRLVSKLIPNKYINDLRISNSQIESFVNHYKSWFDTSSYQYKIVEGHEIKKWYLDDNYFILNGEQSGTLWKSCMRYEERQSFLELYCKNKVKMLILTVKVDDEEKLRARALLWDNVEVISSQEDLPSNIKVMDRIYSVFESDVVSFKKWASENGYICKWEQNAKSHQFFDIKHNPVKIKCQIKLDDYRLESYPYLDTFPFFDIDNGVISNNEYNNRWKYKLVQANGSLFPEEIDIVVDDDDF